MRTDSNSSPTPRSAPSPRRRAGDLPTDLLTVPPAAGARRSRLGARRSAQAARRGLTGRSAFPLGSAILLGLALGLAGFTPSAAFAQGPTGQTPSGGIGAADETTATKPAPADDASRPEADEPTRAGQRGSRDDRVPEKAIDFAKQMPDQLDVSVEQKLDAQVPLDTTFYDENGDPVRLAEFFNQDKPVIINPGYYECPMLCSLVLNGMLESLKELNYTPGEQFELVTLSIDPAESHQLAKTKKRNYISELGNIEAAAGWHFLTGDEQQIARLAEAIGWQFKWNARQQQYAHPAAIVIASPSGRITRYLLGIEFDPDVLRLSIVESSEGKVGSLSDRVLLTCFHYDPEEGKYLIPPMALMRLGGAMTVIVVALAIGVALLREAIHRRRERRRTGQPAGEGSPVGSDA